MLDKYPRTLLLYAVLAAIIVMTCYDRSFVSPLVNIGSVVQSKSLQYANPVRASLPYFHKSVDVVPTNCSALRHLGSVYNAVEQHEQAAYWSTLGLERCPTDALIANNLGEAYDELGNHKVAATYFRMAGNRVSLINHGWKALRSGDIALAKQVFQEVIEDAPYRTDGFRGMGQAVFMETGSVAAAQEWLDMAIAADPTDAQSYVDMGAIFQANGDTGTATAWYKRGSHADPQSGVPWLYLGIEAVSEGSFEEGIGYLNRALQLGQNSYQVQVHLAVASLSLHDLHLALPHASQAVELAPESAYARFVLGRVHEEMGNLSSAIKEYSAAVNIEPENPSYLKRLMVLQQSDVLLGSEITK